MQTFDDFIAKFWCKIMSLSYDKFSLNFMIIII